MDLYEDDDKAKKICKVSFDVSCGATESHQILQSRIYKHKPKTEIDYNQSIIMIIRSAVNSEGKRFNMLRHITRSQLTTIGIPFDQIFMCDKTCMCGKTSEYPEVLNVWHTLFSTGRHDYVLYLKDD